MKDSYGDPPYFVPRLYAKMLMLTAGLAGSGLAIIWLAIGPITTVDLVGTTICTPIIAYLLHLVQAPPRAE